MSIAVGDVIHLDQVISVSGVNAVCGFNYELIDAGSATTDTELLSGLIVDNWNPTFISGVWKTANDTKLVATCVKVQKILPLKEGDFLFIQNIGGFIVGDHYPAHSAVMIVKTGRTSGPGSSGRNFFPGPDEQHFEGGRINALGIAAWNPVAFFLNDTLALGAKNTVWTPQHVKGDDSHSDILETWVSPNMRTVRNRQAVDCPV